MYDFRADHLTGQTPGVLFPGRDPLSDPAVLSCLWLFCGVEASWALPHPALMSSLFPAHLSRHVEETLWASFLMLLGNELSQRTP